MREFKITRAAAKAAIDVAQQRLDSRHHVETRSHMSSPGPDRIWQAAAVAARQLGCTRYQAIRAIHDRARELGQSAEHTALDVLDGVIRLDTPRARANEASQAMWIIASRHECPPDNALARMDTYARTHGISLRVVARAIVSGDLIALN